MNNEIRELTFDELDVVSGGDGVLPGHIAAALINGAVAVASAALDVVAGYVTVARKQ